MGTHATNPLITVHPDTKRRLDELGTKGQTYNDIIIKLLDKTPPPGGHQVPTCFQKFSTNSRTITEWFKGKKG